MFEYKLRGTEETVFRFETMEGIFYPTETSKLLIDACRSRIKAPGKMLDLGCGIGITGLILAHLGMSASPLYASDISQPAVDMTKVNADNMGVEVVVRAGSLFEPWHNEKFNIIVDDVSGISDEVAKISPWFPPGVNCEAGRDGTRWVVEIIEKAADHLTEGGEIYFPILSLSNEAKILEVARGRFDNTELLLEKEWFLPKEMAERIDQIMPLIDDGTIECKQKFGAWVWATKIFVSSGLKNTKK